MTVAVKQLLNEWETLYSGRDPRLLLDQYYWRYEFKKDYHDNDYYIPIEEWCVESLGTENYKRIFNKFWFTDEESLTLFKLRWATGNDQK
jgi:hypothetical protein